MTIKERLEKALPLAHEYLKKLAELDQLDREIASARLHEPVAIFSDIEQVDHYETSLEKYDQAISELYKKKIGIEDWIDYQKRAYEANSLLFYLFGDFELPDIEVKVISEDAQIFRFYSEEGRLFLDNLSEPESQAPNSAYLPFPVNSAVESLKGAEKAFTAMFPGAVPSTSELIQLAQIVEIIYLRQAVGACAPM